MNRPHIFWLLSDSSSLYRKQGEIRFRPSSLIPRLQSHGFNINIFLPYDEDLLPKTELSSNRITSLAVPYFHDQHVNVIRLSKRMGFPGIFMVDLRDISLPRKNIMNAWAAVMLAEKIDLDVDVFHMEGPTFGFVPVFLEQKRSNPIFKKTKTLFVLKNLDQLHPFSAQQLQEFQIPTRIYHPDGVLFLGSGCFLKTGIVFSDHVSFVYEGQKNPLDTPAMAVWRNILNEYQSKTSVWDSDRSLPTYVNTYEKLIQSQPDKSEWDKVMDHVVNYRIREKSESPFPELWGPPIPARYGNNQMAFLIQSPTKGYVFWEWAGPSYRDYGVMLINHSLNEKNLISRGHPFQSGAWLDLNPGERFSVELLGWDENNEQKTLMQTGIKQTPWDRIQLQDKVILVDSGSREKFHVPYERTVRVQKPENLNSSWMGNERDLEPQREDL